MREETMSDRKFEMITATDPTDQFHRVRIRCSHEGCDAKLIFTRRGPISPVQAAKWFRDKHWGVSGHERSDLCPEHYKGNDMGNGLNKKPNIKMKHTNINLGTDTAIPQQIDFEDLPIMRKNPEPPSEVVIPEPAPSGFSMARQMSRADKRIIYNKLDEVYADELTGYRGNWSDEKVAVDLGVPKIWVSSIREDTFGPEINKEKMREELDRIVAGMNEKLASYTASVEVLQTAVAEYDKLVETIDQKVLDFDKGVEGMKLLVAAFNNAVKELKGE